MDKVTSKCDETKRSLDCVWQALGVEHVSLHSSLASHSAGSYDFASHPTIIERSSISASLSREHFNTKIQCRSTDSFRLKGTDLLHEQNSSKCDETKHAFCRDFRRIL